MVEEVSDHYDDWLEEDQARTVPIRRPDTPIHPGEYIREELEARGWTQVKLAKLMDRPARLVNDLCQERRSVSAETALDLAKALGMSPKTWMNLQTSYDLAKAQEKRGGEAERTSAAG